MSTAEGLRELHKIHITASSVYSTNTEDGQNQTRSTSPSKMQNIAMQQEFFLQILLILISFFLHMV